MRIMSLMFMLSLSTAVLGCVSQQTHERAIEELEMTSQNSAQELNGLQGIVEEQQAQVAQLQKDQQVVEETLDAKEAAVVRLQATNRELESAAKVQQQVKEQQLKALANEFEILYGEFGELGDKPGDQGVSMKSPLGVVSADFDDITQAFRDMRSTLASQMSDFLQLRTQNEQLENEMQQLEERLQHVERLKQELEEVRTGREMQEAKLAKVRREVQTVGKEIERITKALEEKFGKSLIVTQHQDRLVLTMLGQVLFESGKAQLTPLGLDIMRQVGEVLATLPNKNIQVEGHTDNNPIYGRLRKKYPTNWELSTARATTVLRYLVEQTGMDPKEFAATGYADTRPIVANHTEEGQAQNRRVEIVLYPERVTPDNKTVATLAQ